MDRLDRELERAVVVADRKIGAAGSTNACTNSAGSYACRAMNQRGS